MPFLAEGPSGSLPLVRAPEVMKFFIPTHSLIPCLMGYKRFGHAISRSPMKWYVGAHAWCLKPRSAAAMHSLSEPSDFWHRRRSQRQPQTTEGATFASFCRPWHPF
jgi:hypothetical protein